MKQEDTSSNQSDNRDDEEAVDYVFGRMKDAESRRVFETKMNVDEQLKATVLILRYLFGQRKYSDEGTDA